MSSIFFATATELLNRDLAASILCPNMHSPLKDFILLSFAIGGGFLMRMKESVNIVALSWLPGYPPLSWSPTSLPYQIPPSLYLRTMDGSERLPVRSYSWLQQRNIVGQTSLSLRFFLLRLLSLYRNITHARLRHFESLQGPTSVYA